MPILGLLQIVGVVQIKGNQTSALPFKNQHGSAAVLDTNGDCLMPHPLLYLRRPELMITFRGLLTLANIIVFAWMIPHDAIADIIYNFSAAPITWNTSSGPMTWDADGDLIHDFQVSVVSGHVDSATTLWVIDNISTVDGNIEKTFIFSLSSLNPALAGSEVSLLGFEFFSEKTIEEGGKNGTGQIGVDVFDDQDVEMVDSVNVTGSLTSSPSQVTLPGTSISSSFDLAIDLASPPGNDDVQVIVGDIRFNGGSIRAFSAVPEPGGILSVCGGCIFLALRRRR